jgi:beta-glucanase (GH16 family)
MHSARTSFAHTSFLRGRLGIVLKVAIPAILIAGGTLGLTLTADHDQSVVTVAPQELPPAEPPVPTNTVEPAPTPTPEATEIPTPPPAAPAPPAAKAPAAKAPAAINPAAVPGFNLVFSDDFNTPAAAGQFLNVYSSKWGTYDGFKDTGHLGMYSNNVISVAGGALDMYLHTENGVPQVAAPVPFIHGGWGGQQYGRYSVRFRADSLPGYKTAWLLWPDSDNWSDGEIDFPEGDLNGTIYAFDHEVGNPSNNAMAVNTGASFTDWHTATTEWTPAGVKFYLDGNLVGSSTVSPSVPMHLILQTETSGAPDASVAGHVQIDSISIWSYTS